MNYFVTRNRNRPDRRVPVSRCTRRRTLSRVSAFRARRPRGFRRTYAVHRAHRVVPDSARDRITPVAVPSRARPSTTRVNGSKHVDRGNDGDESKRKREGRGGTFGGSEKTYPLMRDAVVSNLWARTRRDDRLRSVIVTETTGKRPKYVFYVPAFFPPVRRN